MFYYQMKSCQVSLSNSSNIFPFLLKNECSHLILIKIQTKQIVLRNPATVIAVFYSRDRIASSQHPSTMASEYAYRHSFFSDNFMKMYTHKTGSMQAVFTAFLASCQKISSSLNKELRLFLMEGTFLKPRKSSCN